MKKVIVITGAGLGLGRALSRRFGADGDSVVLLGRTQSKVEAVAAEIGENAMAIYCDVSAPDSVRSAFAAIAERHPRIDVLINNAAVYQPTPIVEASDALIMTTIATNLVGPILCSRSAIPMMGQGGSIINVSSESVELPFAFLVLYQASKAGLEQFSKDLERELAPNGICVTCVRAGSMFEEGKHWDVDPAMAARFMQACMAAGIDLRARPMSNVNSVTAIFRLLVDLPPDLRAVDVALQARRPDG